jgi:outer membrane protein assembly factor BamB
MENSFENLNNAAKNFAVTAATVLVLQVTPNALFAQSGEKAIQTQTASRGGYHMKMTWGRIDALVVGMKDGTPVYKNPKGEFFTLNSTTGDKEDIKPEEFAKFVVVEKLGGSQMANKTSFTWKFATTDIQAVTVLGVDKEGHTIQKNSNGESYYLHPTTGDMVFIKN